MAKHGLIYQVDIHLIVSTGLRFLKTMIRCLQVQNITRIKPNCNLDTCVHVNEKLNCVYGVSLAKTNSRWQNN